MFAEREVFGDSTQPGFRAFASSLPNDDVSADTLVVAADVNAFRLDELRSRPGVRVWRNSVLILFGCHGSAQAMLQPASPGDTDCRPFDPGVPVHTIRTLLGVRPIGERVIADKG